VNLDLVTCDPDDRAAVDDEPRHATVTLPHSPLVWPGG
jgi:hypothetical protein